MSPGRETEVSFDWEGEMRWVGREGRREQAIGAQNRSLPISDLYEAPNVQVHDCPFLTDSDCDSD